MRFLVLLALLACGGAFAAPQPDPDPRGPGGPVDGVQAKLGSTTRILPLRFYLNPKR